MPLYEYKCTQCGHRFERIQSYSAEDVKECPVCQGKVERLISAPVAHFKGSGFYSTDYAAKPSSKKSQDGGDAAGTPAAASDGGASADKSSTTATETSSEKSSPTKAEKAATPAASSKTE